MAALVVMLEEQLIQTVWQIYMADMLCLLTQPKYENKFQRYSELIAPKPKPVSLKEVKAHILGRLKGKGG